VSDLFVLIGRPLRNTMRSPFLFFSLLQPFLWLFLFGNLFSAVSRLPAFGGQSYLGFLAPGVIIMSSSISASYSGVSTLMDLERGTLERLFITPVPLAAIALAPIVQTAVVTSLPALIILAAASLTGAGMHGGLPGIALVLAAAFCTGMVFSGISNTIALLTRQVPAVLGIMNLLSLPLTFTSTMLISRAAMPGWMQAIAVVNPIDWAVTVARAAYMGGPYGADVATRAALLAALAAAMPAAAVLALRRYRRSL
jgi:ABC-2 type transport system permease protein